MNSLHLPTPLAAYATRLLLLLLAVCALGLASCDKDEDEPDAQTVGLDRLQGAWKLTSAPAQPADVGLTVQVADRQAIVTDRANSAAINVGDTKWRDLASDNGVAFTLEDLVAGSDYRAAVLTLLSDSTLLVVVDGVSQDWRRSSSGGGVSATTQTLDADITEATILANTPAAVDYLVPIGRTIAVEAALTVEPGVVINFEEGAAFNVRGNGSLKALGTASEPIALVGRESLPGYWNGLAFSTNSLNNQLSYVTVADAGKEAVFCCGNPSAGVFVEDGRLQMQNSTLRDNAGYGLAVNGTSTLADFSANTYTANEEGAALLTLAMAAQLDAAGSDFAGNDKDHIQLLSSRIAEPTTVGAVNTAYRLHNSDLIVAAGLTVEPGATFVAPADAGVRVEAGGSFSAVGTAAQPISFRGVEAGRGIWNGFHVESSSPNNRFEHCVIANTGAEPTACCGNLAAAIYLESGSASIENTTLTAGAGRGVVAEDDAELRSFRNNVVSDHAEAPLLLSADNVRALDGRGSALSGNDDDVVQVFSNTDLTEAATWTALGVPYQLFDRLDVSAAWQIAPGARLKMSADGGFAVRTGGSMRAVGTPSEPIEIYGAEASRGYWLGVHVESNSPNNAFDYVNLSHAGIEATVCCGNPRAGIWVESGRATVTNSSFELIQGCALSADSDGTLTQSGNRFSGNDNDVCP